MNGIKFNSIVFQLLHINQSHYDDIIEERSILKLCGYPLCSDMLNNIPKQQYIISSAQNKVYDITERKKFCSNKCFKSSVYLREQILTSPLWIRKDEDILPEFKLLSFDDKDDANGKKTDKNKDVNEDKIEDKNEIENKNKSGSQTNDQSTGKQSDKEKNQHCS